MSHLQNRGGALPVGYLARRLDGAREPLSRRRLAPTVDSRRRPYGRSTRSRMQTPPGPGEHTGRPAVEPRAPQGGEPPWRPVLKRVPCFATYGTPHRPPEGWFRRRVTRVPVRLSAYPGFPIGVSFSTPAGYFTHLHRTGNDPTRVAPCCNPAWERTPGLSPLVSACLCVARFGTPGAESGSEVIKHVRRNGTEREKTDPGPFAPRPGGELVVLST